MLKNLLNLGFLMVALVGMTACNSSSDPVFAEVAEVQTGVLVDDPVSGVTFSTPTQNGVTNDDGEFRYVDGEMVTFSIGGIVLGTVRGASIITPVQLTGSLRPTDTAATNQIIFLQSIDENRNPDDGIQVSDATRAMAEGITLDFTATDFDSQVASVITNITGGANVAVSKEDALANFFETYQELGGSDALGFDFPNPDGSAPDEFGWVMVWEDNFDGTELDTSKWTPQIGDGSEEENGGNVNWGNNELQYYKAENATVANGMLTIAAREEVTLGADIPTRAESLGDLDYTSARLRSINNLDVTYGKIETRVKVAAGQGLWDAFWMLPTDSPYGTWAASGEIDIMEVVNAESTGEAFVTLHYGGPFPQNTSSGVDVAIDNLVDEFHTYGIEWEQGEIRWYIDGVHIHTITSDTYWTYAYIDEETGYGNPQGGPFDNDFHMLLNLAVGGNFPGPVGASTVFPQEMLVDYVRVYECSVNPETGEGCASNVDDTLTAPGPQGPWIGEWGIYDDAVGPLVNPFGGERDLELTVDNSGGNIVVTEVTASDPERGTVLDVTVTGAGGSIQLDALDDQAITTKDAGDSGELKFDIYIDSAPLAGMIGFDHANLVAADDLEANAKLDQWVSVSIPVRAFTAGAGDLFLDSIFRFEPGDVAHFQLDNIRFVCGGRSTQICLQPPSGGGDVGSGGIVIQAEDYAAQSGIELEAASDVGGGANIGFVDPDDWLEYTITVPEADTYFIDYRLASAQGSAGFEVSIDGVVVDTQLVPNTGGWQTWITQSGGEFSLDAGVHTLRIDFIGDAINMNWFELRVPGGGTGGDPGPELVTNGSFDADLTDWETVAEVIDDAGNKVFFANVETAGDPWNVNLQQVHTIVPNETYTVSFKAKGTDGRALSVGVGLNHPPWDNAQEALALTPAWVTYSFDITAAGFGDADSRVFFEMGQDTGEVFIDDVSLKTAAP